MIGKKISFLMIWLPVLIIALNFSVKAAACPAWQGCGRTADIRVFAHPDQIIDAWSFADQLKETVSTDCFSFGSNKPEYAFAVVFDVYEEEEGRYFSGFSDVSEFNKSWGAQMKKVIKNKYGPYRSQMIVALYYIGGDISIGENNFLDIPKMGDLLQYWITYGDGITVSEHQKPMLDQIRSIGPLHDFVWDWEAAPAKGEIKIDDICVVPSTNYTFNLDKVEDTQGRVCTQQRIRDINRFVVKVEGTDEDVFECGSDRTEDGDCAYLQNWCDEKFAFKTPSDFNEIKFTIYDSCDILKTKIKPLNRTEKLYELCNKTIRNKERCPQSCNIEPMKKHVMPGETITIRISDIKNSLGYDVKPYDRLFIDAEKGTIQNGMKLGGMRAFDAAGGLIEVKYKAPNASNLAKDTIFVYTSCGTSDEPATTPGDGISRKDIPIAYEYSAEFTSLCTETEQTNQEINSGKIQERINTRSDDRIKATVSVELDLSDSSVDKAAGTMTNDYVITECTLKSFSLNGKYRKSEYRNDESRKCEWETIISQDSNQSNARVEHSGELSVVFDLQSGKVKWITPPSLVVLFDKKQKVSTQSTNYKGNCANENGTVDNIVLPNAPFVLGPANTITGEELADKTKPQMDQIQQITEKMQSLINNPQGMDMNAIEKLADEIEKEYDTDEIAQEFEQAAISPDLKPTGGDGKTSFQGGGKKTTIEPIDNGSRQISKEFKWSFSTKR